MKPKTVLLLIVLSLLVAGCGNKGPLVLPQAPVPAEEAVPELPADEDVPVETPPPAEAAPTPAEPVPAEAVPQDGRG